MFGSCGTNVILKSNEPFWLDLGRRLARLSSHFVYPALLVPARLVSHAPAAARAAARRFACTCRARPTVHPSHAPRSTRQSYYI